MTDDRAVRLALEVGRLRIENDRLRATLERVNALGDLWGTDESLDPAYALWLIMALQEPR